MTINTLQKILLFGSEYFTTIIQGQWESNELRNLVAILQEFLREFVTDPELWDNRFSLQPIFYNKNIVGAGKDKKKYLSPTTY